MLPFCGPDKTSVSITNYLKFLIISHVSLHQPLERFNFLIKITIVFGYKRNSCGGSPATSNSFRNSTEYNAVNGTTVLKRIYVSSGNFVKSLLIESTVLFAVHKICSFYQLGYRQCIPK